MGAEPHNQKKIDNPEEQEKAQPENVKLRGLCPEKEIGGKKHERKKHKIGKLADAPPVYDEYLQEKAFSFIVSLSIQLTINIPKTFVQRRLGYT